MGSLVYEMTGTRTKLRADTPFQKAFLANTIHTRNVGLMLANCRRRRSNIKTRLHKSRSSRSELEFDLSNFV